MDNDTVIEMKIKRSATFETVLVTVSDPSNISTRWSILQKYHESRIKPERL